MQGSVGDSLQRNSKRSSLRFAYIDSDGRGHLPIHDAAHVRNALARFGQTFFESEAKARTAWGRILRAAKRFGIEHQGAMPKPKVREASEGYKRTRTAAATPLSPSPVSNHGGGEKGIATCAVAIAGDEAPEWVELIPAGHFSAVDGRGPFANADPERVIAASVAKMPQVGLVLDYDHSTDLAAPEGRPAPAAGWIKDFKVAGGAIFARIEWTQEAAAAVKDKKYRYVSPVFEHDKDGNVSRILRAALTNNPALVELPALAAAKGAEGRVARMEPDEKPKLSEIMEALEKVHPGASHRKLMKAAAALMMDDDDDDDDDGERMMDDEGDGAPDNPYQDESAEQMARRHEEEMSRASEGERAEMAKTHAAERERFAKRVRGLEHKPETSEMKGEKSVHAAIAKHPMVVKMASELNDLRLKQARKTAETAVDTAIRDGRLIPSQRDWAVEYCMAEPRGFEKFLAAQPRILQSGADGTFTGRLGEAPKDQLSRSELQICARLGLDKDKFIAARERRLSRNAALEED